MKRITIHLDYVEKIDNKIFNTVSAVVSSPQQEKEFRRQHEFNTKSSYVTFLK